MKPPRGSARPMRRRPSFLLLAVLCCRAEGAPVANVSANDLCSATPPAKDGTLPWVAVVLSGNFRTFSDPRVYKTIRSNLIDAIGGNVVTFVYGKLDGEQKPVHLKGGALHSSAHAQDSEEEHVRMGLAYLAEDGREVETRFLRKTPEDIIEPDCPMYNSSRTNGMSWLEMTYIGQVHSLHNSGKMVQAYEERNNISFSWVAKARLDAMWLRSVGPWCSYRAKTAYVISPAPADWFMLLPRAAAMRTMLRPFEHYRMCGKLKSSAPMVDNSASCCGGGPTAQIMGEIQQARVALIGPRYEGSKWGPKPVGSMEMANSLFHTLVMRTADAQQPWHRDWCATQFLYGKPQPYFPDRATCRQITEAPGFRGV